MAELRAACIGWPVSVVPRAVAGIIPEPDAAVVAAWLLDPDPPLTMPLKAETVEGIWRRLHAGDPKSVMGLCGPTGDPIWPEPSGTAYGWSGLVVG
jgi:hypothetical protein